MNDLFKGAMMKKCVPVIFAVMFVAIIFSPAPAGAAGAVNPCDLFTKAEAEAFLKEIISSERSDKTAAPAGNSCTYFYKKKGGTYSVKLKISSTEEIKKEGMFSSAKDVFTRQKKARLANENTAKQLKVITGLGDDAFWNGYDLWIVKGDHLVNIHVSSYLGGSFKNREAMDKARADQDLDQSRKVAEKVLPKIK